MTNKKTHGDSFTYRNIYLVTSVKFNVCTMSLAEIFDGLIFIMYIIFLLIGDRGGCLAHIWFCFDFLCPSLCLYVCYSKTTLGAFCLRC